LLFAIRNAMLTPENEEGATMRTIAFHIAAAAEREEDIPAR
jgi:hypothetical protein